MDMCIYEHSLKNCTHDVGIIVEITVAQEAGLYEIRQELGIRLLCLQLEDSEKVVYL